MTFRWKASPQSAARCFERFMRQEMRGVSFFYVIEHDPDGEGYHVHALWCDCGARRSEIWKKWYDRYGINRIVPIESQLNVTDYCAKHVTKETLYWNIKLLGNRRAACSIGLSNPAGAVVVQPTSAGTECQTVGRADRN